MDSKTSAIISWITALAAFAWGALVMTGVAWAQAEKSTRLVLGGIFLIYGIYRLVTLLGRMKTEQIEEKREEIQRKKDKLLNRK
jgi:hypothetical protein